jgi:DNA-binding NtrC family response regulator
VIVDCAAIPAEALERKLFGYRKGAFPGAGRPQKGAIESAHGGTLVLREIGALSRELQGSLLWVLESNAVVRAGSSSRIPVDVRIISTSSRDLLAQVKKGRFRGDLYFRLASMDIPMPPLRERRSEIRLFVDHFLGKPGASIRVSRAVLNALERYDWLGNVRELKNVVEPWITLDEGQPIGIANLPEEIRRATFTLEDWGPGADYSLGRLLKEIERRTIGKALALTGWNEDQAAELLGIDGPALQAKMKMFELDSALSADPESGATRSGSGPRPMAVRSRRPGRTPAR